MDGATLEFVLRSTDTAGRIGGEKFALMLPETALPAAMALAERLRQTVEQKSIPMSGGPPVSFTVSIGVAELTDPSQGIDDLLKRADQALYQAKSSGEKPGGLIAMSAFLMSSRRSLCFDYF